MDHPAFVAGSCDGRDLAYEFRGGVNPEYFEKARVDFHGPRGVVPGRVVEHDPTSGHGSVRLESDGWVEPGDIGTWVLPSREPGPDRHAAPACDDLAGVAASLAALDRARADSALRHFSVLLTRGEEVGFVGAIHAAITESIPRVARLISVETSPELPDARIGDGPIIRVGDVMTVFDNQLTNRITAAARRAGIVHQRKLMSGGSCEATPLGAFGYTVTGLCLALENHHNRGNLSEVNAGVGVAVTKAEEISITDFHGLVDLILVAVHAADEEDAMAISLLDLHERTRHYLS